MQKKIIRRLCDNPVAGFEKLHPLLQRIYSARPIQSILELEKTFSCLLPYQSLKDIDKAVDILITAIYQQQNILIVGDFDADGATSTALAMRALKAFGAKHISYLVPNRFAFGYGLSPELVRAALKNSPDLIITVDNGIANHAGVSEAKNHRIKVIITDHHLAADTLPNADAIVNPNQPGDMFASKNLAGVGVIFYLMLATRRRLANEEWFNKQNLPAPNMAHLLDLVALGTVADLVALDHNNRIMVHHGLQRINAGLCCPGIIALLEIANRDFMRAQASDLGFAVASRLNAAGRMDDMSLGIECLLSNDPHEARRMARTLDRLNLERRTIEAEMQTQALGNLNKLSLDTQGVLPRGLCLFDETYHQGVIGILASRIKDKYNRPVIVFAPAQGDELKGSARSIEGLHIRDLLAVIAARHPHLILKFGGHAMAAGLSIARHFLSDFQTIFDQTVSLHVTEDQLKHAIYSDGQLSKQELTLEIALLLRDGGPWGQAFPEPIFDDVFRVEEQRLIADKHLKLRLAKEEQRIEGIMFFVDPTHWPNHRCERVHAVYRLDINEFKGRRNLQLIIDHLNPA